MNIGRFCLKLGLLLLVLTGFLVLVIIAGSVNVSARDEIDCRYAGGYGGTYEDVTCDGRYAYGASAQGLSIFDVSNNSNPEEIGFFHTFARTWDVTVEGDHAFIAASESGLVIVNISDRTDPKEEGVFKSPSAARGVAVTGDYAYVVDYEDGLFILDITNKSNPYEIGHYDTSGSAYAVVMAGDYAYVADYGKGLIIVDISNKTSPEKVGSYNTGYAEGVTVDGDFAYVADRFKGMIIINITDKSNPEKVGSYDTSGWAYAVEVEEKYAYLVDGDGLLIIDITDKKNPRKLGDLDTLDRANGIDIAGNFAYLADGGNGLVIMDIADRTDPKKVAHHGISGSAWNVLLEDDYAYIADGWGGIVIVDISDRCDPKEVGSLDTSGITYDLAVEGDFAYLADDENGLVILDIKDRSNPKQVGHKDTSGNTCSVAVDGDYAYLADGEGLFIVDISDKGDPKEVSIYNSSGSASDVIVMGNYAYVTAGSNGLVIVDISDKEKPEKVGEYDTSDSASGIDVAGNYAYIADNRKGLIIVDISNKSDPQRVGGYYHASSSYFHDVVVGGDYAYLANDRNGMVVVDIKKKNSPWKVGSYGSYGHYEMSGNAKGVAVDVGHVYIADYYNGLVVVEFMPVAWIDRISPNPAPDTVDIHFEGHGTYWKDRVIERFVWTSSIYGELHDDESSNFSSRGLSRGKHTISLKVLDNTGVWSSEYLTQLTISEQPKAFINLISPNSTVEAENVRFEGYGTDDDAVAKYVWFSSLDGEIHNSTNCNFSSDKLSNGTHLISFKVQDNDGLWSDDVSEKLLINVKPRGHIIQIAPNPAIETDIVKFVGEGLDDGNITRFVWSSSIDGEISNRTDRNFNTTSLSFGEHTIYLTVKDDNNLWSSSVSAKLVFTKKPEASIDSIVADPVLWNDTIEFKGSGTDGDGFIERFVWTSSSDGEIHNSTDCNFSTDDLSSGRHTIYFKVVDNFGVWSEEVSKNLNVNKKPRVRIYSISPDPAITTETITFHASGADDGMIMEYNWFSSIDGMIHNGSTSVFSMVGLSRGTHTISLKVRDDNGIWSNETSAVLMVHEKPVASINSISPSSVLSLVDVTFNGSGTDDGTIERFVWSSSIEGELYNGTASIFKSLNLSVGNHTIIFKVQDNFGVWSEEVNDTLVILIDSDNDTVPDILDAFPNDMTEWNDTDEDGVGDNSDAFPHDEKEWTDLDSDGVGDNSDTFPNDKAEWNDTDLDGVGDNSDTFPNDKNEWTDSDSDGIGDNADAFPGDPAASLDTDGDGYPNDWNTGKTDADSTTGLKLDAYPDNADKWKKEDGDSPGFGGLAVFLALLCSCALQRREKR